VARRKIAQEIVPPKPIGPDSVTLTPPGPGPTPPIPISPPPPVQPTKPKRYHGTVVLDPERVGRDAGEIADEVITHLVGLVGSSVRVTLEIEAEIPAGVPDHVVRTVTENGRTLRFTNNSGFEME
jgi:hypothetical protein